MRALFAPVRFDLIAPCEHTRQQWVFLPLHVYTGRADSLDEDICKLIWWLLHLVIGMCTCTCSLHVYVHGMSYIVLSFRRPTSPPPQKMFSVVTVGVPECTMCFWMALLVTPHSLNWIELWNNFQLRHAFSLTATTINCRYFCRFSIWLSLRAVAWYTVTFRSRDSFHSMINPLGPRAPFGARALDR